MKDNLILNITKEMESNLTEIQLNKLKKTLIEMFDNVEIIMQTDEAKKQFEIKENIEFVNIFISSKLVEGCSDRTIKYYRETIEKLIQNIDKSVKLINTDDIRKYLSWYKEQNNCNTTTIDNIRRILSSFFSWLEDEDFITKSPVRRIHKIKTATIIKATFTDECLEKMRDKCTNIRDLSLIELLASTGMRVGEVVNLNIKDLNFGERSCIVLGKGNKQREVYFDAKTKIHLLRYLNIRKDSNKAMFVSMRKPNNRLSISAVELVIRKVGNRSKVDKAHPHKFRRTLATIAIDKGMPIEQVQRLLGHVKIETTMHYAMVSQNNVKISHRKYIG